MIAGHHLRVDEVGARLIQSTGNSGGTSVARASGGSFGISRLGGRTVGALR